MESLFLVLGLGVGGVAVAVTLLLSKKNVSHLTAQLEQTHKDLERLRQQSSKQVKSLQQEEADAKQRAEQDRKRAQAAQQSVDQYTSEMERLTAALRAAEQARDQAIEQLNTGQSARQQAEGRLRQAEKLASDSSRQAAELEQQVQQLHQQVAAASSEAQQKAQESSRLRAEVQAHTGNSAGLGDSVELFADANGSLEQILGVLVEKEGQRSAVLADANGIVVASAGDSGLKDGIAAAAQLFSTVSNQFEGMVPFGHIKAFAIQDGEHVVIAGRTFAAAGEIVALATYGSRSPNDRTLDGAMASLSAALD